MTLPTVPIPKITALFSHALAIERLRELEPLAKSIHDGKHDNFLRILHESHQVVQSIGNDIVSTASAIEAAPDIFAFGGVLRRDLLPRSDPCITDTAREKTEVSVTKLVGHKALSTEVIRFLEILHGLQVSGECNGAVYCSNHAHLISQSIACIVSLQSIVRSQGICILPDTLARKIDLRRTRTKEQFVDDLGSALTWWLR